LTNAAQIIGHNGHQYIVDAEWGKLDAAAYPVGDCHEMVIDSANRLYLLNNNTQNNVLVYDLDGNLLDSWGTTYPGAHGLSLGSENGTEFLLIADHARHQIIKTTLEGEELMIMDYPVETGCYNSAEDFLPTETVVAPNGDIYVTDGYGLQYVIQYSSKGEYIRHWGGRGSGNSNFNCAHGVVVDTRQSGEPTLLITSRNENAFKRFTLQGDYLETIHLPGSFVCRPRIKGKYLYAAVFRSIHNMNLNSGYITILDASNHVVSTPGGTAPVYMSGKLLPQQHQEERVFMHPHDVAVDNNGNIYVCQWKADNTYPVKLIKVIN
jgi:DNA-binding beta-propeller fold protein YncE